MVTADVVVIGAGPAGLSAAIAAAEVGADVLVCERDPAPGGQLVKQTHRFFGSEREGAGIRGFSIGEQLCKQVQTLSTARMINSASAVGFYNDRRLLLEINDKIELCSAKRYIFAVGASERGLLFSNNDIPGIYGAGAVQTLMNVYGVAPGNKVLMVGSGNIGLIVSYQLLQAGVDVAAIVEGLPRIGGYLVHASKVRRMGVPILTQHTLLSVRGTDCVQGAVIAEVAKDWSPIEGTQRELDVDVVCLAVGLQPLSDLLWQAGCNMVFVPELGGYVPWHDESQRTSARDVFVAGDSGGVEEASSAMMTGRVAGATAAYDLGYMDDLKWREVVDDARSCLERLRSGPTAEKIRSGLQTIVNRDKGVVAS